MIVCIYNPENFQTNGCGCCSSTLSLPEDREEIIEQLKRNIRVAKEGCEILGITLEELCEE